MHPQHPLVEVSLHTLLPKLLHNKNHRPHKRLRLLKHWLEDPQLAHQLPHQKQPQLAALPLVAPQPEPRPLKHKRRQRSQRQQGGDRLRVCREEDLPLLVQLVGVLHLVHPNHRDRLPAEVDLLAVPHRREEVELPHLLVVEEHQQCQQEEAVPLPQVEVVLPQAEVPRAQVAGEAVPVLEVQPKAPSPTNLQSSAAKR